MRGPRQGARLGMPDRHFPGGHCRGQSNQPPPKPLARAWLTLLAPLHARPPTLPSRPPEQARRLSPRHSRAGRPKQAKRIDSRGRASGVPLASFVPHATCERHRHLQSRFRKGRVAGSLGTQGLDNFARCRCQAAVTCLQSRRAAGWNVVSAICDYSVELADPPRLRLGQLESHFEYSKPSYGLCPVWLPHTCAGLPRQQAISSS